MAKGLKRSLADLYERVEALEAASGENATVTSAQISDATTVGRALLTAASEAAAREAINAAEDET